MLKARRELDLASESVGVYLAGELLGENLEYDSPFQRSVERNEQPAHPATAELPLEDVGITELRFESGAKIRQRARFRRRYGKLCPAPYRSESTSARDADLRGGPRLEDCDGGPGMRAECRITASSARE